MFVNKVTQKAVDGFGWKFLSWWDTVHCAVQYFKYLHLKYKTYFVSYIWNKIIWNNVVLFVFLFEIHFDCILYCMYFGSPIYGHAVWVRATKFGMIIHLCRDGKGLHVGPHTSGFTVFGCLSLWVCALPCALLYAKLTSTLVNPRWGARWRLNQCCLFYSDLFSLTSFDDRSRNLTLRDEPQLKTSSRRPLMCPPPQRNEARTVDT